jgi:hypothetical protein
MVNAIIGIAIRFKKKGILSIYKYSILVSKSIINMEIYLNSIAVITIRLITFIL